MNNNVRTGNATRIRTSRLHIPERLLPIVYIPGFLGTRLEDPDDGELVWNPVGFPLNFGWEEVDPGVFAVKVDKLMQMTRQLRPAESNRFLDDALNKDVEHIRNYHNLIAGYYGEMAKALANLDYNLEGEAIWDKSVWKKRNIVPRVYCCGYDWRQDNARSALRLAEVVDLALAETGAKKVIVIAHSNGGLVTRYYSRMFGGEAKIHTVFLVASPTMGSTIAYSQLKSGFNGVYAKEHVNAWYRLDARDATLATYRFVENLNSMFWLGATDSWGYASKEGLLGAMWFIFCLGANRELTRKETRTMARTLTSLYQLLPNPDFCRLIPDWLVFDPFLTGIPSVGPTVVFPSMFDSVMDLSSWLTSCIGNAGAEIDNFKNKVLDFINKREPQDGVEISSRTKRSGMTLYEAVDKMGEGVLEGAKIAGKIYEAAKKTFVDARAARQLYYDIYAGLMDDPAERALVASNLEMMFKQHTALTIRPKAEETKSVLATVGKWLGSRWDDMPEIEEEKPPSQNSAEGKHNVIYMHPRTINLYCDTELVDPGSVVIPLQVLNNHDSNEVQNIAFSNWSRYISAVQSPSRQNPAVGDGTVPVLSADPPSENLSTPFMESVRLTDVLHGAICNQPVTIREVSKRLQAMLAEFCATGL